MLEFGHEKVNVWMCRTLASALAVTGLQVLATGTINGGKVVPDGTNVWIGAATGGGTMILVR